MYGSTVFLVLGVDERRQPSRALDDARRRPGLAHARRGACDRRAASRSWLREILGEPSFEELARRGRAVAPGARGLLVLPYFAGERTPILDPQRPRHDRSA